MEFDAIRIEDTPSDSTIRRIEALENSLKNDYEKITRRVLVLETIILKEFGSKAIVSGEKIVQLLDKNMMQLRSSSSRRSSSKLKLPSILTSNKNQMSGKKISKHITSKPSNLTEHSDLIKIEAASPYPDDVQEMEPFEFDDYVVPPLADTVDSMNSDSDSSDTMSETKPSHVVVTRSGRRSKPTAKSKLLKQVKGEDEEIFGDEKGDPDSDGRGQRSSKIHMCDQCGKTMTTSHNLRVHRLRIHSSNRQTFPCEFCDKKFPSQFKRDYHLKIHTEVRPHKCDFSGCTCAFKFRTQLMVHYRVHQSTRKYSCNVCGKTYKHKSGLNLHMMHHKQMKLYGCPQCEKKCYTRTHVKRHLRQFHKCDEILEIPKDYVPEEPKPPKPPKIVKPRRTITERIVCDQCGTSVLKNNFKHHLGTHDILFNCDQCGKGFSTEFALKSHVEHAHDLDKPYMCNYPECESRFNSVSNLRTHKVSHTAERRFHCTPCNRSYKHKGGLNVHINACHSKNRQFPCQICPSDEQGSKIFDTRTHLKRHMIKVHKITAEDAEHMTKVEKKEKEVVPRLDCEQCGKTYKTKHELRLHQNSAHTHATQFPCNLCSKKFYRKNHQKRHLQNVHGTEVSETCEVNIQEEAVEMNEAVEINEATVIDYQDIPSSSSYPTYQTIRLKSGTIVRIVTELDIQHTEEV